MKKLGVILLSGISVFGAITSQSQSLEELALLFSKTNTTGSARILGMGGVQNSLGGDFSSAGSNPAGIGMFNRSEFTISPTLSVINSRGVYGFDGNNDTVNTAKTKVSIPSMSYAIHFGTKGDSWIGSTLIFTLTRINDFNSTLKYEGINPYNSITDYFAINSDGINPNSFDVNGSEYNTLNRLAYNTYLIDADPNTNPILYVAPVGINFSDNTGDDVPRSFQTEKIESSGKQNQWSAAYGANLNDRFFFGASIYLRSIHYSNKKSFSESSYFFKAFPSYNPLHKLVLEENLDVNGNGFSGAIGAIVRPIDGLQVGLSYNLPTFYQLKESYTAYMSADWNNFDYYGDGTTILDGVYDNNQNELLNQYKLKTPGKVSGGATYFFKKLGFVSADVDVLTYSNGSYKPWGNSEKYDYENERIDTLYKSAVNFRIGGEFRLKNIRLRSGFGLQTNPYEKKKNDITNNGFNFSLGVGYRGPKFYADAALVIRTFKDSYNPYTVFGYSVEPVVSINTIAPSLNFTLGFPF